jgi:starvation-inducible DNA-binding protein
MATPDTARFARPHLNQHAQETQRYGHIIKLPIGLDEKVCSASVEALNQMLADTMTLRDLYKKHHWQVAGPTFNTLHLLFDKHFTEQAALVDLIAERIQVLGGVSIAMAADVAEVSQIPRAPRGREAVPMQLSRLLEAHELIIRAARHSAEVAQTNGDSGTNDLLVSDVLRTNELQVWFLSEHLVEAPAVEKEGSDTVSAAPRVLPAGTTAPAKGANGAGAAPTDGAGKASVAIPASSNGNAKSKPQPSK